MAHISHISALIFQITSIFWQISHAYSKAFWTLTSEIFFKKEKSYTNMYCYAKCFPLLPCVLLALVLLLKNKFISMFSCMGRSIKVLKKNSWDANLKCPWPDYGQAMAKSWDNWYLSPFLPSYLIKANITNKNKNLTNKSHKLSQKSLT